MCAVGGPESQKRYLEIRDKEGDTPLHHAVKGGHVKVIELLLNRAPGMLNQPRSNGRTPLFDALERPAIVRLLLRQVRPYMAMSPDVQLIATSALLK